MWLSSYEKSLIHHKGFDWLTLCKQMNLYPCTFRIIGYLIYFKYTIDVLLFFEVHEKLLLLLHYSLNASIRPLLC